MTSAITTERAAARRWRAGAAGERPSPQGDSRRVAADRHRSTQLGFTLLEVMLGLALLGLGLSVLIRSAATSIFNTQQAHMIGVATDLARAKMYDIEDKLIKDGFSDTTLEEEDQTFSDEGWPLIHYSYKAEVVELPSWDDLQKIVTGRGSGSGSAGSGSAGSDGEAKGGFGDSALGGLLSQFGGGGGASAGSGKGGGDIDASIGSSFVQGQYTMFQQILKVSLRKVSLTVKWQVLGSDRDMKVVAFFTDAASMDKVINGLGSQDLDDANAKSGSGGGSGSGRSSNTNGNPSTRQPGPGSSK